MENNDVRCLYCGSDATRFSDDLSECVCETCYRNTNLGNGNSAEHYEFLEMYEGEVEEF